MLKIKHVALSAFEISYCDKSGDREKSRSLLIDPFIKLNPSYNYKNSDISDIFITHGHSDHVGQSVEIALETNALVTTLVDIAAYMERKGVTNVKDVGIGSWLYYSWGRCIFLPAIHANTLPDGFPGSIAASILFEINGIKIFHAGDTCLTMEFKAISEIYHPDIALLPIGGRYGMDIEHALIAAEWIAAKTVIPMHYYLPPVIDVDPCDFQRQFQQKFKNNKEMQCVILSEENSELIINN